ncbi:MAG: hypothetical protein Q9217_000206 [Psora testacea]
MPSPKNIFVHNVNTFVDILKGQYDEDQWYKRYRAHLWTKEDDRFTKTLLAIAQHGRTELGKSLQFKTVDQILRAMVREEGKPPCIKYVKRAGFSSSKVFGAEKIYRASQKPEDPNYSLYRDVKKRRRSFWEAEADALLRKYQGRIGSQGGSEEQAHVTGGMRRPKDDDSDSRDHQERSDGRKDDSEEDEGLGFKDVGTDSEEEDERHSDGEDIPRTRG